MNRIDRLFANKTSGVLSVYFTAGYPALNDTLPIVKALSDSGVDMIEIGMPFSDPLADGPVIQRSSQLALENGMSLGLLFDQLKTVRELTDIPLLLMGYLNPVMQFGRERLIEKCVETGIDGLIIPDLPLYEYEQDYRTLLEANDIHNVFLITPQTSHTRLLQLAQAARGFLYMVSSASTTGARLGFSDEQIAYFERIKSLNLSIPRMIGFGISNREDFLTACSYASGSIIGSALIRALQQEGEVELICRQFVQSILGE